MNKKDLLVPFLATAATIVIGICMLSLWTAPARAQQWLPQGVDAILNLGPFVDEDDGKTLETGLTITSAEVRLSKNGADIIPASDSNAAAHDELGVYKKALDETDTDTLGRLDVYVWDDGSLIDWQHFMVVDNDVWATFCGTGAMLTAVTIADGIDASSADSNNLTAKINTLEAEWRDGGRLDLILDDADAPTAAENADAILEELVSDHESVVGSLAAMVRQILNGLGLVK